MPKQVKIVNISNPNIQNSDDELEIKSTQPTPVQQAPPVQQTQVQQAPPVQQYPENVPKKKRTLNLTEEERERRRLAMLETRKKRDAVYQERKLQMQELAEQQAVEAQKKAMKKLQALEKKQEKQFINQMVNEKVSSRKAKQNTIIEEFEDDSDSEYETVITKSRRKKVSQQTVQQTPVQQTPVQQPVQPPVYQPPKIAFRWV